MTMARRRPRRRRQRGFALFAIIILLALMTAAVALSLDQAVANIRSAGGVRAAAIIKAGLDHGLDLAMAEVNRLDIGTLANPPGTWDLFAGPNSAATPNPFLAPVTYPSQGPYANQYQVRFGLRPGQRTRATAGEDVNRGYGQIVEIQISIEAIGPGVPPAEERVTVGVLVPRRESHAN